MSASLAGSSPEPTGRAGVTGSTGASGWAAFLAPQTAERLGYLYRKDEEEGMLRYLRWLKAGGRGEP